MSGTLMLVSLLYYCMSELLLQVKVGRSGESKLCGGAHESRKYCCMHKPLPSIEMLVCAPVMVG